MVEKLQNYVDGEWVTPQVESYIPVMDPATCEVLAEAPESTAADVDAAVQAAHTGFIEWRQTPILSRAQYMHRLKTICEDRFEGLSNVVVQENGITLD